MLYVCSLFFFCITDIQVRTPSLTFFKYAMTGLFLERAREPVALYFGVGLSLFAGPEPGGLSVIW